MQQLNQQFKIIIYLIIANKQTQNFSSLNLSSCNVQDKDLDPIFKTLSQVSKQIEIIALDRNQLKEIDSLLNIIKNFPNLIVLDISQNQIQDKKKILILKKECDKRNIQLIVENIIDFSSNLNKNNSQDQRAKNFGSHANTKFLSSTMNSHIEFNPHNIKKPFEVSYIPLTDRQAQFSICSEQLEKIQKIAQVNNKSNYGKQGYFPIPQLKKNNNLNLSQLKQKIMEFKNKKMTRMSWLLAIKFYFEKLRDKDCKVHLKQLISQISNISQEKQIKCEFFSEEEFKSKNFNEIGFTISEVIQKLFSFKEDKISFDEIFNLISHINQQQSPRTQEKQNKPEKKCLQLNGINNNISFKNIELDRNCLKEIINDEEALETARFNNNNNQNELQIKNVQPLQQEDSNNKQKQNIVLNNSIDSVQFKTSQHIEIHSEIPSTISNLRFQLCQRSINSKQQPLQQHFQQNYSFKQLVEKLIENQTLYKNDMLVTSFLNFIEISINENKKNYGIKLVDLNQEQIQISNQNLEQNQILRQLLKQIQFIQIKQSNSLSFNKIIFSNLTYLNVSNCNLQSISFINESKNLKFLNFCFNNIKNFNDIQIPLQLSEIHASNNKIIDISSLIKFQNRFSILNFQQNCIFQIEQIKQLLDNNQESLKILMLEGNSKIRYQKILQNYSQLIFSEETFIKLLEKLTKAPQQMKQYMLPIQVKKNTSFSKARKSIGNVLTDRTNNFIQKKMKIDHSLQKNSSKSTDKQKELKKRKKKSINPFLFELLNKQKNSERSKQLSIR